MRKRKTLLERLLNGAEIGGPNDCWPWKKCLDTRGYGKIGVNGSNDRAHRVSYRENIGEIPKGKVVRHTCDNRPCINPTHLIIGTQADNINDGAERNRFAMGESHHMTYLSKEQVASIFLDKNRTPDVAKKHGIPYLVAWSIRNGTTWGKFTSTLKKEKINV